MMTNNIENVFKMKKNEKLKKKMYKIHISSNNQHNITKLKDVVYKEYF